MCTLAFHIEPGHEWPLIVVANRDEFLKRETQSMHWWQTSRNVLAGKDLQSGGTWAAASNSGRFAMLTNFRDPKYFNRQGPTRGKLVLDAVEDLDFSSEQKNRSEWEAYNGFNLLWGSAEGVHVYSNVDHQHHHITSGVHGLSNAHLDTPWPKVSCIRNWLKDRIAQNIADPLEFIKEAFEALEDPKMYPQASLPATGVGEEMEHSLSALRVQMDGYGSRLSTVYIRHRSGFWYVGERSFDDGVRRFFQFEEGF